MVVNVWRMSVCCCWLACPGASLATLCLARPQPGGACACPGGSLATLCLARPQPGGACAWPGRSLVVPVPGQASAWWCLPQCVNYTRDLANCRKTVRAFTMLAENRHRLAFSRASVRPGGGWLSAYGDCATLQIVTATIIFIEWD